MINLLEAEVEALFELSEGPWELWTEGKDSRIVNLVLKNLCARGMAQMDRVNATVHRFTIRPAGRQFLDSRS